MDYLYVILHVSAIITFLSYIFPAIERYSKMAAANLGRTERINTVNNALRMIDSLRSVIADRDTEQVNK